MNRSISKIRHIQEANQKLENRLLSESVTNLNESIVSDIVKKVQTCFDPKKYPNTWQAANGSIKVALGLVLIAAGIGGEFLSLGLGTLPAVASIGAGVTQDARGIRDIYQANLSKIDNELKAVVRCALG